MAATACGGKAEAEGTKRRTWWPEVGVMLRVRENVELPSGGILLREDWHVRLVSTAAAAATDEPVLGQQQEQQQEEEWLVRANGREIRVPARLLAPREEPEPQPEPEPASLMPQDRLLPAPPASPTRSIHDEVPPLPAPQARKPELELEHGEQATVGLTAEEEERERERERERLAREEEKAEERRWRQQQRREEREQEQLRQQQQQLKLLQQQQAQKEEGEEATTRHSESEGEGEDQDDGIRHWFHYLSAPGSSFTVTTSAAASSAGGIRPAALMMAVQAGWPDELGDLEAEELEELLADTAAGGAGAVGDGTSYVVRVWIEYLYCMVLSPILVLPACLLVYVCLVQSVW